MPVTDFVDCMPHTITYAPASGTHSDRGTPTYGTAVSYTAMIEPVGSQRQGEVILRDAAGRERVAKWKIIVATTTVLNADGQLTLPSGFDPQVPPVFNVTQVADENGIHHNVIHV